MLLSFLPSFVRADSSPSFAWWSSYLAGKSKVVNWTDPTRPLPASPKRKYNGAAGRFDGELPSLPLLPSCSLFLLFSFVPVPFSSSYRPLRIQNSHLQNLQNPLTSFLPLLVNPPSSPLSPKHPTQPLPPPSLKFNAPPTLQLLQPLLLPLGKGRRGRERGNLSISSGRRRELWELEQEGRGRRMEPLRRSSRWDRRTLELDREEIGSGRL